MQNARESGHECVGLMGVGPTAPVSTKAEGGDLVADLSDLSVVAADDLGPVEIVQGQQAARGAVAQREVIDAVNSGEQIIRNATEIVHVPVTDASGEQSARGSVV